MTQPVGGFDNLLIYQLNERLWLAGQPQPEQMSQLRAAGVRTLINMRTNDELAAIEAENARDAELNYLYLPLPAYELDPPHMAEFAQIVDGLTAALGEEEILCIHCRSASRVALMWMLKRMLFEEWTEAEAEAELVAAGYDDDSLETFRFCVADYFERAEEVAEEEEGELVG